DLVGAFPLSGTKLCCYSIDVSGHGVTSALMTARLAGYLSNSAPEQNVVFERCNDGSFCTRPPARVIEHLNQLVLEDLETEHYFTMVLAEVDLESGDIVLAQAGHPHPLLQRADGSTDLLGDGGLPVGLIPGASYSDVRSQLGPGDRLLLYSDGISECPDPDDRLLDEDGLMQIAKGLADTGGGAFLDAMMVRLAEHAAGQSFPDDISAVLLEFDKP
ncbi:MAG: PP2C family protein-serine/threonine phosphatase, partial [Pseudomonadota bacterium]